MKDNIIDIQTFQELELIDQEFEHEHQRVDALSLHNCKQDAKNLVDENGESYSN